MRAQIPSPTTRVRFRTYRLTDVAAVEAMFADPQSQRFYPDMGNRASCESWIQWNIDGYASVGIGLWAIEQIETGIFLGDCGLTYQRVAGDQLLELGYHLDVTHRGNGYASEAGQACVDFAFGTLGADSLCSIVDPDNDSSIAVAQRLHDKRRSFVNESGHDMLLFWTDQPTDSRSRITG